MVADRARLLTPRLPVKRMARIPRPDRLYHRLFPSARRATVSAEQVQAIVSGYGLSLRAEGIETAAFGRSESIVLATSGGKKVLKRYKRTLSYEAILHEHSILTYLEQIEFAAPRLARTLAGNTLLRYSEDEHYALFDYLSGYFHYHNYLFLPAQTHRLIFMSGEALAALHLALKDVTPEGRNENSFQGRESPRWRELRWFLERLESCRQPVTLPAGSRLGFNVTGLLREFETVEATLVELDDLLQQANPPRLIIHGDYGPYNLLFKPGSPAVILDFELARLDWRLTDFANALPSFAQNRLGFSFSKMRAFLDGYRTLLPLSGEEMALLPAVWQFLALRRAIVCCYRFVNSGNEHWAREAQERLHHARWVIDNRKAIAEAG